MDAASATRRSAASRSEMPKMRRSTASYSVGPGGRDGLEAEVALEMRHGRCPARPQHELVADLEPAIGRRRSARSAGEARPSLTTRHGASPLALTRRRRRPRDRRQSSADQRRQVAWLKAGPRPGHSRSVARRSGSLGAGSATKLDQPRLRPLDGRRLRGARAARRCVVVARRARVLGGRWIGGGWLIGWPGQSAASAAGAWMMTRRAPSPRRMAARASSTSSSPIRSLIRRSIGSRPSR